VEHDGCSVTICTATAVGARREWGWSGDRDLVLYLLSIRSKSTGSKAIFLWNGPAEERHLCVQDRVSAQFRGKDMLKAQTIGGSQPGKPGKISNRMREGLHRC
jgi:hypothetical protein